MREYLKTKFTSRKFIACLAGVLTGLGLILSQNTVEGATTVAVSILGYLAAEGYIDAAAVKKSLGDEGNKGELSAGGGKRKVNAFKNNNQTKTEV